MERRTGKNSGIYDIKPEHALSFLVKSCVSLKLLSGFAEISGSELVIGEVYLFNGPVSVIVFTWQGCTLEFHGEAANIRLKEHSCMIVPTYLHACLEERRKMAESEHMTAPRCLVVGRNFEKSLFCKILLNYAARLSRQPLFIELNVDDDSISLPGTISILQVEKPSDVADGFWHRAASVFSFGYTDPSENRPLYLLLIKKLGELVKTRMAQANENTCASGFIINTPHWRKLKGYSTYKHVALAFDVNVIFVMENVRLFHKLKETVSPAVEVVYVPKQSGTSTRKRKISLKAQNNHIKDYFYGLKVRWKRFELEVNFSEIQIYKIVPGPTATNNNIPPQHVVFNHVAIVKVEFGEHLHDHILSLSSSDTADENLLTATVIGFVCVIRVCFERKVLTVLSPEPLPLPSKILVKLNIKIK